MTEQQFHTPNSITNCPQCCARMTVEETTRPGRQHTRHCSWHPLNWASRPGQLTPIDHSDALSPYRLPDGTMVLIREDVARGAQTITYTLKGGQIVEAQRVITEQPKADRTMGQRRQEANATLASRISAPFLSPFDPRELAIIAGVLTTYARTLHRAQFAAAQASGRERTREEKATIAELYWFAQRAETKSK